METKNNITTLYNKCTKSNKVHLDDLDVLDTLKML